MAHAVAFQENRSMDLPGIINHHDCSLYNDLNGIVFGKMLLHQRVSMIIHYELSFAAVKQHDVKMCLNEMRLPS